MTGVGRGTSWGGISFLNGIPTGVGATGAIRLPVEVTVEPAGGEERAPEGMDRLVQESLLALREDGTGPTDAIPRVRVRSAIPQGQGLKSSSALSVALLRALFAQEGRPGPAPEELAALSARTCRAAGLSVTGAYDDALASARGGLVVADVRDGRALRVDDPPPGLSVLVWLPGGTHPEVASLRQRWNGVHPSEALAAETQARAGRYLEAMELNSQVVERTLGYPWGELRRRLREEGALAAGVSGNGPALAVLVPAGTAERFRRLFLYGELLTTTLVGAGEVPP
jgi:shikimate kinase